MENGEKGRRREEEGKGDGVRGRGGEGRGGRIRVVRVFKGGF